MSVPFTPQQVEIIDSFGQGQAVIAGAGCGKTTTLVAKCLRLLEQNPKAKFCAVSFTEKSVSDLREALHEGLSSRGWFETRHDHWVKTIHGLCSTIIRDYPSAAGLQGGERILLQDEADRTWKRSVDLLWSSNDSKEINDAITELLKVYSRANLETLLQKLRGLLSFGVESFIQKSIDRPEVKNLWIVFESVHRRYRHAKERLGALDFNDLEWFALKALEKPEVRKYYHHLFDLVLVDEFQDTNPVQGNLLELFAKPESTNLCIVGDPKQSIYRFRDADVTVFFDLSQKLPKRHLLNENYRSRPEIIQLINEVCAPVFEASQLEYEPLIAGRASEESAFSRVRRIVVDDSTALARFLSEQEQSGIDLSEFALLARSLKGKTQVLLQSLTQAGIPYVLGSGGRFYSDPRVQELVAFLKSFCSPENKLSHLIALRSPWIQWPDELILSAGFHGFLESDHPVAVAVRDFTHHNKNTHKNILRPGELLETLWKLESLDEEMQVPILTLWHKCEDLSMQGLRYEEVVYELSQAIEKDKVEREVPPPATQGAVRVMTIHASKGLQFKRVILTDFDGPTRTGTGFQDLIWDRKHGVHLFERDEGGKKKDEEESSNLFWTDLEKRNAISESKRLFYVALTRAQEELLLLWNDSKKPSKEPFKSDDWRGWVQSATNNALPDAHPLSLDVQTKNPTQADLLDVSFENISRIEKIKIPITRYRPRHSPSEWRILNQCSYRYQLKWVLQASESVPQSNQSSANVDVNADQAEKNKNRAAEKGEKVHLYLETENWESLKSFFKTPVAEQQVNALKEKLTVHKHVSVYRELGFEVPLSADEALVGMMDRFEVDESSQTIRVIDYKWTEKEKTEQALLQDYQLQLQLYAWAGMRLVSFVPKKIEAQMIHLTPLSLQTISLDQNVLEVKVLENLVQHHFELSKTMNSDLIGNAQATVGEHCRHCEYQSQCQLFQSSKVFK